MNYTDSQIMYAFSLLDEEALRRIEKRLNNIKLIEQKFKRKKIHRDIYFDNLKWFNLN